MLAIVCVFLSYFYSLLSPRHELALEVLASRHQIMVLKTANTINTERQAA